MDDELEQLRARAEAVGDDLANLVRQVSGAMRWFKILMIVVGGGLATGMQFVPAEHDWRMPVGVLAALAALVGGVLVAFTERDAASELNKAQRALDLAQLYLSQRNDIQANVYELNRSAGKQRNLHEAARVMRETIEQAIVQRKADERELLTSLLEFPERLLRGAMDFEADERWIVSIFKREERDGRTQLVKLFEQRADRSEESDDDGAVRSWEPGEGFAGAAFVQRGEVVLPDLNDPEVSRLIFISSENRKDHENDPERYRSCAAVSVLVGPRAERNRHAPWGVVTAASNKLGRFHYDVDEPGFQHAEAVRLVAEMVALAVGALHMCGGGGNEAGERSEPPQQQILNPLETRD